MSGSESPYEIPPECICLGDGLMGMKCEAAEHARLKMPERDPQPGDVLEGGPMYGRCGNYEME